MGEIIKMTCRDCGRSYHCKIGAGMEHGRLDSVIKVFGEETGKHIMRCVEDEKFPMFSFAFQPMCCECCNAIVSVPVLKLLKEDEEYVGRCQECQTPMEQKKVNEQLNCPVCKNVKFDTCRMGFWD